MADIFRHGGHFNEPNLVHRAHVPFGQHQDTELWNNQQARSQSLTKFGRFPLRSDSSLAEVRYYEVNIDVIFTTFWFPQHCKMVGKTWSLWQLVGWREVFMGLRYQCFFIALAMKERELSERSWFWTEEKDVKAWISGSYDYNSSSYENSAWEKFRPDEDSNPGQDVRMPKEQITSLTLTLSTVLVVNHIRSFDVDSSVKFAGASQILLCNLNRGSQVYFSSPGEYSL